MSRATNPFPFALPPRPRGASATRWLYESLRAAILGGRLGVGSRLPTTRELAKHYGLARGTVVTAFENLKAEGYVSATVGSGTYVACVLPESLLVAPRAARSHGAGPHEARRPRRRLAALARRTSFLPVYDKGPTRAFRIAQPALDLFPTTLWARVASRRLRLASAKLLLGCEPLGYEPLRAAIAEYLVASRGVMCSPEQVAIVSGTLQAMSIVARLLIDPGDRAVVESPGYIGMWRALEASGATIVPVPVDDEGLVVDVRRMKHARLVYVTPAHQHPMGVSMSVTRRLALLDWAGRSGATIFEDDYDSEYRYSGPPMPALQGLDRHGRVIFAGSFSKVLFPSLRLGYVALPPDLVDPFASVVSVTMRHAPLPDQAILAEFITGGHFGRHIRRMREVYAERHAALVSSAKEELSGLLDVCPIEAGLQTVGWLPAGVDSKRVAALAAERAVEVRVIDPGKGGRAVRHALQLGFAAVDAAEIRRGVRVLREVVGGVVAKGER
ncbi:MAG TPA: PLP-dependent aminotransferase family protein [Candidatus Eisenbacteria bacterium]